MKISHAESYALDIRFASTIFVWNDYQNISYILFHGQNNHPTQNTPDKSDRDQPTIPVKITHTCV